MDRVQSVKHAAANRQLRKALGWARKARESIWEHQWGAQEQASTTFPCPI